MSVDPNEMPRICFSLVPCKIAYFGATDIGAMSNILWGPLVSHVNSYFVDGCTLPTDEGTGVSVFHEAFFKTAPHGIGCVGQDLG